MDARDSILSALGRASLTSDVSRTVPYRHAGELDRRARTQLFAERVVEYGARVQHVTPGTLSAVLQTLIIDGGFRSLAVPFGLPPSWYAGLQECKLVQDCRMVHEHTVRDADLADVEAVLTRSTAAVAVSGSIILQHGEAQGRRALTLLPDHLLCVVDVNTIFETLPEALDALEPTRPTTIISGPSATADIEMTRIQGVHGPRQLTVLLLSDSIA